MTTLALITIGQAPRVDLTPEVSAVLPPGTRIVEHGALDELDAEQIAALAPREGEHALVSRLRDGGSVVFGHDQAVPLVEEAVARAEAEGAEASLLACSGAFPAIRHERPFFQTERLAHDGVRGLLSGTRPGRTARLGVVRPLPEQLTDAADQWEDSIGLRPAALAAASPYTDSPREVADAAAGIARDCDLIVLDCIGYDEAMCAAAREACAGVPVVTVRSVAARLLGALL